MHAGAGGRGGRGGPARQPPPPPPPLDPVVKQADECFSQANRSKSGFLSPGELLCQVIECGIEDPANVFPAVFLCLDANGDGKISKQEMRDGYKRFARSEGVRARDKVSEKDATELEALETQAQGFLAPKVAALEQVFQILTLSKAPDPYAKLTARKLAAFQKVLADAARKDFDTQVAEAIAAQDPKAAKAAAEAGLPPPGPPPTKLDKKVEQMIGLDLNQVIADMFGKSGAATQSDDGELELDFAHCKSLLARHPGCLAAAGGGGKKGKKKK